MVRSSHVFLFVLLLALLVQTTLWRWDSFTDEDVWLKRIVQLHYDVQHHHYQADNPVYSGHPGMPAVAIGALAYWAGASPLASLRGSITLLVSLSVAAVALLCRVVRPYNSWWISASAMVLFHPLYVHASPTNAVVAPLAVVLVLFGLMLYERPNNRHLTALILWGSCIGLVAATRLVTAVLLTGPLLLLLLSKLGWRSIMLVSGTGLVTLLASDPLWWYTPVQHLRYILFRSSLNYTDQVTVITLSLDDFVLFAPFGLLSLLLAITLLIRHRHALPLPRPLLLTLLAITVLFSTMFLSTRFQSLRHFYPIIFLWEALLPLFLIHVGSVFVLSFMSSQYNQAILQTITRICIMVFLVGSQFTLLLLHFLD